MVSDGRDVFARVLVLADPPLLEAVPASPITETRRVNSGTLRTTLAAPPG
ncbi:MAG TPA: hypothetical protein VMH81_06755 [Bryobacteraceae bacterium]|nr:hypothetical protein [Bryobacteraceae bacterium]